MSSVGFSNRSVQMPDGTRRRYVVFVPHAYTTAKTWPAILFLHGAGERGDDNKGQVRVGIGRAIRAREKTWGFITVMPQCAAEPAWWTTPSEKAYAMAALAKTQREYSVDDGRIYLTGLSMGGFGTWALAADHPRRWAAIVPICGRGDPGTVKSIVHLPCWCFHGADDETVPPKNSRDMIAALKTAGGQPRYTEYPGVGHNSWDKAYGTDELYTWMLSHRRKVSTSPSD
jgi:predicted peptidase